MSGASSAGDAVLGGHLWLGTNEESVVELMLDCLSPCASTREGMIEEAAWEAYGKGWG
jgi:hypothetical protein